MLPNVKMTRKAVKWSVDVDSQKQTSGHSPIAVFGLVLTLTLFHRSFLCDLLTGPQKLGGER